MLVEVGLDLLNIDDTLWLVLWLQHQTFLVEILHHGLNFLLLLLVAYSDHHLLGSLVDFVILVLYKVLDGLLYLNVEVLWNLFLHNVIYNYMFSLPYTKQ